jgi:formylglycine-generating enzyme required for sulfatase activity
MKQNYKIFLCALLLLGAVNMMTIGAYAQKPKIAILVVGLETDAASDAFATGIRYEFTQKDYELITNTAVAAKLKELRDKHAEGKTVDTAGLAAWGKAIGLDFAQLVVESDCDITIGTSTVSGREQLAQVVSCGAAKYSGRSTYRTRFVPNQGEPLEEMVFIVGGVFEMGCKSGRDDITTSCYDNEIPVHYVRVNNFYMGKYEVTQGLWKKVMGSLPSSISGDLLGDDKPVVRVTWRNIADSGGFLEKLNEQTGKNYRLPTEAEWEYAARGCSGGVCESFEFSGSGNVEDVAWHNGNATTAQVVGTKAPNRLGIYNMSGNVWEWCNDWYSTYSSSTEDSPQDNPTGPSDGTYRALRGGGWYYSAPYSCITYRYDLATPNGIHENVGFRLVMP